MIIKGKNANEAFVGILKEIKENGIETSPRGLKIKELINANVIIENPEDRIVSIKERKFSPAFAFGELCWYMQSKNDLETMSYYSAFMKSCSDDGQTLNSAYGYRISGKHTSVGFDQLERAYELLREDSFSRQAVIHVRTPSNKFTKDEVCTMSLQFLIRNEKLDMITTMRSNDIVFGFTYDIFSFTMMQSLLAQRLGVKVGTYYHNAGSLHIYEKDFELLSLVNDMNVEENFEINVERKCMKFIFALEKMFREMHESDVIKYSSKVYLKAILGHDSKFVIMSDFLKNISILGKEKIMMDAINSSKELFIFVYSVFLTKAIEKKLSSGKEKNECLSNVLQELHNLQMFKEEQLILNSLKPNNESCKKIIYEGIDKIGKSTRANIAKKEVGETGSLLKHYPLATDEFKMNAMAFLRKDLTSKQSIVFDRSFISEMVYSKVLGRKSYLSKQDEDELIDLLKSEDIAVNILVKNSFDAEFLNMIKQDEGDKILQVIEKLNEEYKNVFERLKERKVNVELFTI